MSETPRDATGQTERMSHTTPERTTAPMSGFTGRQAGIGALVLVIGLLITFAIPLVFA